MDNERSPEGVSPVECVPAIEAAVQAGAAGGPRLVRKDEQADGRHEQDEHRAGKRSQKNERTKDDLGEAVVHRGAATIERTRGVAVAAVAAVVAAAGKSGRL